VPLSIAIHTTHARVDAVRVVIAGQHNCLITLQARNVPWRRRGVGSVSAASFPAERSLGRERGRGLARLRALALALRALVHISRPHLEATNEWRPAAYLARRRAPVWCGAGTDGADEPHRTRRVYVSGLVPIIRHHPLASGTRSQPQLASSLCMRTANLRPQICWLSQCGVGRRTLNDVVDDAIMLQVG